jgi:hypothetical protein
MWAVFEINTDYEINLDRFSRKGPNEKYSFHGSWEREVEDASIICKGCNEEIVEGDDFVESEIWEDEFIHNYGTCIERYYKKEKDPFAENKRVGYEK